MKISETASWKGRVRVIARHRDGTVTVEEFDNLITDAGLNLLRDLLEGVVTDGQIKYLAWGNDATAPSAGETELRSERGRKAVTSRTAGAAGVLTTLTYVAPYEAVEQIEELGWFAGDTATSAAGSGIMVARVLYSRLKTDLESIQVDREDTIGAV